MRGLYEHCVVTCIQLIINVIYRLAAVSTKVAIIHVLQYHVICEKEKFESFRYGQDILADVE